MAEYKFVIRTDESGVSDEEAIQQGLAATWAAIEINVMYFRRHPEAVCALACGQVKYDSKNKDVLAMIGEISTAPILIKEGKGLCIDIVAFDVGVKRFEGLDVWPHIFSRGGGIFHVVTQGIDKNGQMIQYDPSAELEQRGLVVSHQPANCRACRI
ncbi:MAG: hypothetical protein ACYTBS_17845 [Planctomycetota bacterium]|jgi:hypothetical protein